MSLANSAQNRKFVAVEGTSVDKKFAAKSFYARDSQATKSFLDLHNFLAKDFSTKIYARLRAANEAKENADAAFAATQFPTKKSSLVRQSVYQDKSTPVRPYADNRPFLAKGTRQDIIDQQNHVKPMTIEQVRELLNTNR